MLAAALLAAVSPTSAACQVGRVAMHDLLTRKGGPDGDALYAAPDASRPDLLVAGPWLQVELPAAYPLAGDNARARADVHAPIADHPVRPATIFSITVPVIDPSGTRATVRFSYDCTGLCGTEMVARFVKTAQGWRRDGEVQTLWVS